MVGTAAMHARMRLGVQRTLPCSDRTVISHTPGSVPELPPPACQPSAFLSVVPDYIARPALACPAGAHPRRPPLRLVPPRCAATPSSSTRPRCALHPTRRATAAARGTLRIRGWSRTAACGARRVTEAHASAVLQGCCRGCVGPSAHARGGLDASHHQRILVAFVPLTASVSTEVLLNTVQVPQ